MQNSSLIRWGGLAAIGVGLCSLLYGVLYVALIVLGPKMLPPESLLTFGAQSTSLLLGLSGLLGLVATVAFFEKLRAAGEGWARLALWFGMFSALLGGLHGWSDFVRNPALARLYEQPNLASVADTIIALPSPIDPRGIGTFGLAGLGMLVLGSLIARTPDLPRNLANVARFGAVLLLLIFIGTVLWSDGYGLAFARYLFLVPGPIQSIIVGPLFYIWFGLRLRQQS